MRLIKIGGGRTVDLEAITEDIANFDGSQIIVHGANALRDKLAKQLEIEKEIITSISGYDSVRSTSELIDVMLMSYAGLQNKRIVEKLLQNGINAIGLSGIDGKLIKGRRNRGIKAIYKDKRVLIRDNSGKPIEINVDLIELLVNNGYTPVITVPIVDENLQLINSENDDIVALMTKVLPISEVIFLIEEVGLLSDQSNKNSLISVLNRNSLDRFIEEADGRIKRKLYAISKMIQKDTIKIYIGDGRIANPISKIIEGNGTLIQN